MFFNIDNDDDEDNESIIFCNVCYAEVFGWKLLVVGDDGNVVREEEQPWC